MPDPKTLLDQPAIEKALARMTTEILARNASRSRLAVVGIHTRGVVLAKRIHESLQEKCGASIPFGTLDITLYRDDFDTHGAKATVRATDIPFHLDGKDVILVDDVLFTGRTTRAALTELVDFGRPSTIQLAVLVDRGHRELPIQPDYVGARLDTHRGDSIRVRLAETDPAEEVVVIEGKSTS